MLLDCIPVEREPVRVLAVENGLRCAILEPDHVVLPCASWSGGPLEFQSFFSHNLQPVVESRLEVRRMGETESVRDFQNAAKAQPAPH